MRHRRKFLLILALTGLAVLIVWALWPAPVPVSAAIAERGHFEEFVEEEGRTTLRDPYRATAPISGYLRRVELDAGDEVAAGDVLFELEPSRVPALDARTRRQAREAVGAAAARVEVAMAELETQEAEVGHARREFERVRRLADTDAVSMTELDQARRELDFAQGNARAARARVEAARHELSNAEAILEVAEGEGADGAVLPIRSPVNGVVLRRDRWSEGPIQAGERVMTVGDLSRLEVQVDLLSMDAVRVAEGMKVILTRWGGETDLAARVRRVEPAGFTRTSALGVEEQRVPVWVVVEDAREEWESLGEEYRVEARFILWEGEDVLQVPGSALFRAGESWAVFVVENGRAELRPVEPGRRSGLSTQIRSGLEEGDVVITHPGDRVEDGSRIEVD